MSSVVLRTGFSTISATCFRKSTLKKGKKLLRHIFNVEEVQSNSENIIHGFCVRQASISKDPYKVELQLNGEREVIGGRCSCISGKNDQMLTFR